MLREKSDWQPGLEGQVRKGRPIGLFYPEMREKDLYSEVSRKRHRRSVPLWDDPSAVSHILCGVTPGKTLGILCVGTNKSCEQFWSKVLGRTGVKSLIVCWCRKPCPPKVMEMPAALSWCYPSCLLLRARSAACRHGRAKPAGIAKCSFEKVGLSS